MLTGTLHLYRGIDLVRRCPNAIHQDLIDYLTGRLDGATDLALTNMFGKYDSQDNQAGNDGIIFQDALIGDWYTMQSAFVSAPDARTRQVSGIIVPDETITVQNFQLGHDLQASGTAGDQFSTMYATNSQPEEENFFADVPMLVVWEYGIDRE